MAAHHHKADSDGSENQPSTREISLIAMLGGREPNPIRVSTDNRAYKRAVSSKDDQFSARRHQVLRSLRLDVISRRGWRLLHPSDHSERPLTVRMPETIARALCGRWRLRLGKASGRHVLVGRRQTTLQQERSACSEWLQGHCPPVAAAGVEGLSAKSYPGLRRTFLFLGHGPTTHYVRSILEINC